MLATVFPFLLLATASSMETAFVMGNGKTYRDKSTMDASVAVANFAAQYQHSLNEKVLQTRAAAQLAGRNKLQRPKFFSNVYDTPIGTVAKKDQMYFDISRRIRVPESIKKSRSDADQVEQQLIVTRMQEDFPNNNNNNNNNNERGTDMANRLVVTTFPTNMNVANVGNVGNLGNVASVANVGNLGNVASVASPLSMPMLSRVQYLDPSKLFTVLNSGSYSTLSNAHLLGRQQIGASFSYSSITG